MVTAAGDDKKFSAGQTILKQAGIGLAFIAASWLIVSMIFWVISGVTSQYIKLEFYFYSKQKMKQKIAAFMMGLVVLAGSFGIVSADTGYQF